MTLDKSAHPPTGSVHFDGSGPTNSPSANRICHFNRCEPTNSPSIKRVCHFDRSGPTLFPTFAPAKVSAHAVEKSLFDRPRRPLLPNATITTQLLKRRKLALCGAVNLPFFNTFQTLASFAQFPANALSCYQQLTASFCALFVTFRTSSPLFSTSCGLFCAKHGGRGCGSEKN